MAQVTVLVVEDEFIVAHDIRNNLEECGYQVIVAKTGASAIEYVRSQKPDIALLDINLGRGMDGIKTAELIQATVKVPIIYVTAHSDRKTFDRAKSTEPHAFIVKPFNFKNLHSAVELALYNYSIRASATVTEAAPVGVMAENSHYLVEGSIFIKAGKRFEKVLIDQVNYIKAAGSYTVVCSTERDYTISQNLNKVIEKLDHPDIIRIHRTYAINIRNVNRIDENSVVVAGHKVPMQKNLRQNLLYKLKTL